MPEQVTVQDLIRREAKTAGVPESLALAVADQESGFNPTVTGPKLPSGAQAIGTFQLLPDTAKTLGVDPNDPAQNIRGGVQYLRQLLDRHNGDLTKVLGEYGGVKTDTSYVPGVLARLPKFQTAPTAAAPGAAPGAAPTPVPSHVGQPPPGPETWGDWALRQGRQTLEAFDPRTPAGRRNLAGAGGAALGTAAVVGTAPVSLPVAGLTAAAAGIAGAVGGGMLAESGEQIVGMAPPSGEAVVGAGVQQGAYEALGQGITRGVINPIGRHLIGSRVGRFAAERLARTGETLSGAKQALVDRLGRALDATQSLAGVAPRLRPTSAGAAGITPLVAAPPSAAVAGRRVVRTVFGETGGAKIARDIAGQAVEQAAETGPPVNIAPIKERARAMVEQATPPAGTTGEVEGLLGSQALTTPAERATFLQRLQDAGVALEPSHPLPGVLSKLEAAPDEVSFAEAHRLKRVLDEAVNWESPAKKQVQQITKGVRQTLRDAMSGHAPYDRATAKYAEIAPLYTKGIAPRLRKLAVDEPEAIVRLLDPKKPTQAEMLTHLLTTQAAAGGGGVEGREALRSVQAAWIHKRLIEPGIEKLGQRIDKLPPEFTDALLGDSHAREVLRNLSTISSAYQAAVAAEKGLPEQEALLAKSSLFTKGTMPDVLRATMLAPHGEIWGLISLVKLMRGPTARDLVTWASASPPFTRALVTALTSSTPALAVADLTRRSGILSEIGQPPPLAPSHTLTRVGQPPPAAERTALPTMPETPPAPEASPAAPAPAAAPSWSSTPLPSGQIQVTSPTGRVYYAPDQATADAAIAAANAREKGR